MDAIQDPVGDLPEVDTALAEFRQAYPAFESTSYLDALRATEYGRLDRLGHVYLDYTGGGVYAESQVRQHEAMLRDHVYGNPHSSNPTSLAATHLVEQTRAYVLRFFRASPDEYEVVFTPNATGALKLVGESYPFGRGDQLVLTFDNHNSVNGIREFARARGADVRYVEVQPPDLRVDSDLLRRMLRRPRAGAGSRVSRLIGGSPCRRPGGNNLFAFPAQSNFSGVQHPLEWIAEAQSLGWDVLVDGAAFAPSNRLDLSRWHPDFVDLSFYKICGYPTGVGCLIARKSALAKLRRPWYAGGTITLSSVKAADAPGGGFYLTPGPAGFEDGTVNYLSIPAVEIGLRHVDAIGIDLIHTRVGCLTGWLLAKLASLRHGNGQPLVQIYGPLDQKRRGGTISMNFFDPSHRLIDCHLVEERANRINISLRSGCHCNPGAREVALGFSRPELAACFKNKDRMSFAEFRRVIDGKTTGTARVSVGLATTFADVFRFYQFAASFRDRPLGGDLLRTDRAPQEAGVGAGKSD